MKKVKIKVIPNAKKSKILQQGEILKVYITAPPVDGKANKVLIKFLAEYFKVKKSALRIAKGEKSREKIIEIES